MLNIKLVGLIWESKKRVCWIFYLSYGPIKFMCWRGHVIVNWCCVGSKFKFKKYTSSIASGIELGRLVKSDSVDLFGHYEELEVEMDAKMENTFGRKILGMTWSKERLGFNSIALASCILQGGSIFMKAYEVCEVIIFSNYTRLGEINNRNSNGILIRKIYDMTQQK